MDHDFYKSHGKWKPKTLCVGLAALLVLLLVHLPVLGVIALGVAAFFAKPSSSKRPPDPQTGDWYILRGHPDHSPTHEVGFIREYRHKWIV